MDTKIEKIIAKEILDSRGNPTLETTVFLCCGAKGIAAVPSGASTGKFEAVELRDGDKKRYNGLGVLKAIKNIDRIIMPAIKGMDASKQKCIDNKMISLDGTENKEKLGANAILSVSLAVARAVANAYDIPLYKYLGGMKVHSLPIPMMNILNGGAHAFNNLDIQEFMIVPMGATSFTGGLRMGAEVYQSLKKILNKRDLSTGVGDEGGFAPNLQSDEEALDLIMEAIKNAGYESGKDIFLALDVAASEWAKGDSYHLPKAKKDYSREKLIQHYSSLCQKYPICSLEDPLGEEDFLGFVDITKKLGSDKRMIVGDDLFVTNEKRLEKGIEQNAANSILIKVNQIGTLTETLNTIEKANKANYKVIISHRSGETEDTFIADLAVAVGAPFIKSGAPCRSERVAKYNRLINIEYDLYNN